MLILDEIKNSKAVKSLDNESEGLEYEENETLCTVGSRDCKLVQPLGKTYGMASKNKK